MFYTKFLNSPFLAGYSSFTSLNGVELLYKKHEK
jgi:hypothetical protein